MNTSVIIQELSLNQHVFNLLFSELNEEVYLWKPNKNKWCLLEIVCHLYDEEREDFRARTKHILENSSEPFQPINPTEWVLKRKYIEQNFTKILNQFLKERKKSVEWLQSLKNPNWNNTYNHQKFGEMTAKMFLSNWLAHDYLHIKQILKLKFDYLKQKTGEDLTYAGNW